MYADVKLLFPRCEMFGCCFRNKTISSNLHECAPCSILLAESSALTPKKSLGSLKAHIFWGAKCQVPKEGGAFRIVSVYQGAAQCPCWASFSRLTSERGRKDKDTSQGSKAEKGILLSPYSLVSGILFGISSSSQIDNKFCS